MYDNKKLLIGLFFTLVLLMIFSCILINAPKIYQEQLSKQPIKTKVDKKQKVVTNEQNHTKKIQKKPKITQEKAIIKQQQIIITKEDKSITLSGKFPSQQNIQHNLEILKKHPFNVTLKDVNIDENIKINPNWQSVLLKLMNVFEQNITSGKLSFLNNTLFIQAQVSSENQKKNIINLSKWIEDHGIKTSQNINIIKPKSQTTFKQKLAKLPELKYIKFKRLKSVIEAEAFPLLDKLSQMLKESPNVSLIIEGHTDSRGDAISNKILSLDRADAIKEYLVKKGIEQNRLETIGYGESKPAFSNEIDALRVKNRRVEFKIKGE